MINRIAEGMLTGHFTQVEIPTHLVVGEDVIVTVGFYANNPDPDVSLWDPWKTFVIADSYQLGGAVELDATREIHQVVQRTHTYNLGPMPNKLVAVTFNLFAHPDGSYDWDWGEYQDWLYGYPTDITHLAIETRIIHPVEAPPDLKVLRFSIIGEEAGGEIDFNPPALDAEGHYEKGTVVCLTAIVNTGFVFVRWHGDVNEPRTSLINSITMDENHTVRAEFAYAEVEKLWPLEVDIRPAEGGYVTTSPPPADIANYFTDGTIGKFIEDTRVQVTAHPNAGYEFDRWADEIQGGTSYSNPEFVAGVMDEHKAVKAHFREVEGPPPPECFIDADCPTGYVCFNGVCIPEEEVPPPPPEEKKFPWVAAGLIGGGALLLIASMKPEKR